MSSKQALRKQLRQTLRGVDGEQLRVQGERCAEALRELAEYRQARTVAFYMHMDAGELPTTAMIANAFADRKRVFLPSIVPFAPGEAHAWYAGQRTHLRMLEVPTLAAVRALEPRGRLRLREPVAGVDCLDPAVGGLDLVVLPGVAFTAAGSRLGHGAGFYDSFVAEHEAVAGRAPRLVGAGLREQLVESLVTEAHDRLLDAVVIDGCVFRGS